MIQWHRAVRQVHQDPVNVIVGACENDIAYRKHCFEHWFTFHFQVRKMAAGHQRIRKRTQEQGVLDSWPRKKSKPADPKEDSIEDATGADGM